MTRASRITIVIGAAIYFAMQVVAIAIVMIRHPDKLSIYDSFREAGRFLDYAYHPAVPISTGLPEINLNPPTLFPLFQLFAQIDTLVGKFAWLAISVASYLACVWALRRSPTLQVAWLFICPLAVFVFVIGQIYFVLFILATGLALFLRRGRSDWAAVLLGILVAIKPNFATCAAMFFVAGYRREAVIAGAVAAVAFLVPVLLYGADIYRLWFEAMATDSHYLFTNNTTIPAVMRRFGVGGANLVVVGGAILSLAWAYRRRPDAYDLMPVALTASILFSPLAWLEYLLVVVPFFVDRPWRRPGYVAAILIWAIPTIRQTSVDLDLPVIPINSATSLLAVLILFAIFLSRAGGRRPAADDTDRMVKEPTALAA